MNTNASATQDMGRVIEAAPDIFSKRDDRELPVVVSERATPMGMLAIAVQKGMDVATIRDLLALQKEWEANEARKAYAVAMADFKHNPPAVYKDKTNAQYGSMYTTIGNLVSTINVALGACGLTAHWDVDQSQGARIGVSCIMTHAKGHSERVTMFGPPDDSGKKNPLQQIKSTVTYLKIATFEAITGIASQDGNLDDDGQSGGSEERHEDAQPKPSVAQPQRKSDQRGAPEDSYMSAQAGRAEAPIGNQHAVPAQIVPHPKTSAAQENGSNGADAIPKPEPASAAGPGIDPDGPVLQPQQVKILLKRMESAALTDLDIKAKFGKQLGALKAAQFNAIADYLKNPAG